MDFIVENLFLISVVPLVVGSILSMLRFYSANKHGKDIILGDLIFSITWIVIFSTLTIIGNAVN